MKYIEIEGVTSGKVITVTELDRDQDVEIEVKNTYEGDYVSIYLSVSKVRELIEFLQNQIKDL